jgi:hypothetical protein
MRLSVRALALALALGAGLALVPSVPAVPGQVTYRSFRGERLARFPWAGRRVVFLTASRDLDRPTMAAVAGTFDRVYEFYAAVTGRQPRPLPGYVLAGRTTVAEVQNTCGAGCGMLGSTGIEIQPAYFQTLYDGVRTRGEYDQVLFYEFGRNFWFYGRQLEYQGADNTGTVTTGYAVFMRFVSMQAVGVKGGPFRGKAFPEFRRQVGQLVDLYLADPTLNWGNTLRVGKAPANPMGLGSADLFASFVMRLRRHFGGDAFVQRLWGAAGALPPARTTQQAVDNFVLASSAAAGRDLTGLFAGQWRWPVSARARMLARGLGPRGMGPPVPGAPPAFRLPHRVAFPPAGRRPG